MADLSGQSLGRYHILEKLGEGGMAVVYKAFDTLLERDVAVKVIRRGAFPEDHMDRILKRFEREAKALAKLSHPNIIKVIDYGEYENSPYLVMEYLPGGTLKQRLKNPIQWQEAIKILTPIAEALEYAHENHVVHRDIKPSNILLTSKGQPMLTDFGIAKILETEDAATLTGTGIGVGTPEYMAPEQWTGHTSPQSDLYSLGVVLYEMLTGRKPYTADTPAAILLMQASEPLPKLSLYVRDLPARFEMILLKMLAKDPKYRYQDMQQFIDVLKQLDLNSGTHTKIRLSFLRVPRKVLAGVGMFGVSLAALWMVFQGGSNFLSPANNTEDASTATVAVVSTPPDPTFTVTPTVVITDTPDPRASHKIITICSDERSICLLNGLGGDMKRIAISELPGTINEAAWAPDGERIVISVLLDADLTHDGDIFIYNINTAKTDRFTDTNNNNDEMATWSPDGKTIAAHSNCAALITSVDKTSAYFVAEKFDTCVYFPRWSPDSKWLAWASPNTKDGGDTQALEVMNISSQQITTFALSFTLGDLEQLAWSPDGQQLYLQLTGPLQRRTLELNMSCFEKGCDETNLLESDFVIPINWLPNYFPQWAVE